MMRRHATAALAALGVLIPVAAGAFPDDPGARALAMGGAGRADARADEGPRLNPAGMALARVYTVEGAYQLITRDQGQTGRVAIVDSTSEFKLAMGIFYAYRFASPTGVSRLGAHEGGVSAAYPFGETVAIGVTGKYLRLTGGVPEADGSDRHTGVTVDVGATIRAASVLTLGVVGYNLHDLSTAAAPVAIGYGAALLPMPDLVVVADAFHDFTTSDPTRGVRTTVGAGVEYVAQRRFVARAGGGHDGGSGHAYVSAGFAGVAEVGAIEIGARQDVTGDRKLSFVSVGLRLFVASP